MAIRATKDEFGQESGSDRFPEIGVPVPLPPLMVDRTSEGPLDGTPPIVDDGDDFDDEGRHGETPRDRAGAKPGGGSISESQPDVRPREVSAQPSADAPANASPRRPSAPESMAGSISSQGVTPFTPMTSGSVGSMATPALRGLYGASGGLKGGGLGVPLDPVSNQASDPIDTLIQLLTRGQ